MTTRITLTTLLLLGLATATLNVLGRTTISEYVWAAVDHSPVLIGVSAVGVLFLARRIWRRRERLGWLAILSLGGVWSHWFWVG